MLGVAVKLKMRRDNPALGIKLDPIKTDRLSLVDRGRAVPVRGAASSRHQGAAGAGAPALHGATAQRHGCAWPAAYMRDGELGCVFKQSKTGAEMDIPVAAPLAEIIAATPWSASRPLWSPSTASVHAGRASATGFATAVTRPGSAMLGPRTAQGVPAAHGRGRMQRGLHRLDQRPQGLSRDQEIRAGRQQSEDGDQGHGANARRFPVARPESEQKLPTRRTENCQLFRKAWKMKQLATGRPGRSGGDSNPQPPVLETGALAIELHSWGRRSASAEFFMPFG